MVHRIGNRTMTRYRVVETTLNNGNKTYNLKEKWGLWWFWVKTPYMGGCWFITSFKDLEEVKEYIKKWEGLRVKEVKEYEI